MLLKYQKKTYQKNFIFGTAQLSKKYGVTNFERKFEKKKEKNNTFTCKCTFSLFFDEKSCRKYEEQN